MEGYALREVEDTLRKRWAECEDDYRDDRNYEGSEVVYEDDEIVIVADRSGHELPNLLRDHEVPTRMVKNQMSDIAADKTDYDWEESYPIVFPRPKLEKLTGAVENHSDLSVIDASELPEGADVLVSGRTGHEKTGHALEDEYLVCIAMADENDCMVYDGYASGPREYDVTNEVTHTDSLEDAIQKAASLLSKEVS